MVFTVSEPLRTADEDRLALQQGDKGRVVSIDEDGDAEVELLAYSRQELYYIQYADFGKLQIID